MTEDAEQKQGFKIVDRRRFDSDGQERTESSDKPKKEEKSQTMSQVQSSPTASEDTSESQINFSSFIMSLATQALMQMGEMEVPTGVSMPKDLSAAKQTIDVLVMMQEKTKGNLDEEENYLFTEILHNLRMSYVKVVKKG